METINAIVDLLLAAVGVSVVGSAVYMVIIYGWSGAWAKRIEWKNLMTGPLIFGMMLLGLRFAPMLTTRNTAIGLDLAADEMPNLRRAMERLVNEVREPTERVFNVDSGTTFSTDDNPYSVVITSTPLPTPVGPDFEATATVFFEQFPTALPEPTESAPTATPEPTVVPTAQPGDPGYWSHDRPPTPQPGGGN